MARQARQPRQARRNVSGASIPVAPTLQLSPEEVQKHAGQYDAWHWGLKAQRVVDWKDPDMPRTLIACGRLVRLHVRAPKQHQHPRRQRDTMIQFSRQLSANSYVSYDPEHPLERLYLLLAPKARAEMAQVFWKENNLSAMPLNQLASLAGGEHGRLQGYPDVMVKPVGVLTALVYLTHKKGDGTAPNYYIHNVGEVSLCFPFLAADANGRLWIAGGNTRSPTPGITD